MMTLIKSIKKIILKNCNTLIWFEITYKIIGFCLIYPLIEHVVINILKVIDISYISQENIYPIFTNPLSILLAFLAFLIFTIYVYLEIVALMIYCEEGWQNRYISILKLWKASFFETFKIFHYKNLPILLGLVPIVSLSFLRIMSGNLNIFRIPEFIMEFIINNKLLALAFSVIIIFINILSFSYIFGFTYIIVCHQTFVSSWKNSLSLLHKKNFKTLLILLAAFIIFSIIVLLIGVISIWVLFLYSNLFLPINESRYTFQLLYIKWSKIGGVLLKIFSSLGLCSIIIMLYHQYRNDIYLEINKARFSFKMFVKRILAICCTFVLLAIYSETDMGGNIIFSLNPYTKIVAHRAGADFAPENTISALNEAINDRANIAEIDVQQLKDGTLIVMHDSNFKRTTGIDKNVWDIDYDMVKSFDAGSIFSLKFKGEKIPTLEQMLIASKNRIDLMIELKATGYEQNLEEDVIKLINKYEMNKQCIIASMNLDILKHIKNLDSSLKTIYISTIFISDSYDLDYVNGYSIEASSISREMVSQIHFKGKEIYAWTTNSERTIKKVLKCEVDGVITDNPLLAYYCLTDKGEASSLTFFTELFYPIYN